MTIQRGFEGMRRSLAGRCWSLFLLARQSLRCSRCGRCCVSFQLLFPLLQENSVLLSRQTGRTQTLCIRPRQNNIFPPLIIRLKVKTLTQHLLDFCPHSEGRPMAVSSSSSLWLSPFTDSQCMTSFLDGLIKIWTATRYYSCGRLHIHPPGTNTFAW